MQAANFQLPLVTDCPCVSILPLRLAHSGCRLPLGPLTHPVFLKVEKKRKKSVVSHKLYTTNMLVPKSQKSVEELELFTSLQ